MSKYNKQDLREKARIALKAKDSGDQRWLQLGLSMMIKTGLPMDEITARLERLAQ